jgi:hypothetical protein
MTATVTPTGAQLGYAASALGISPSINRLMRSRVRASLLAASTQTSFPAPRRASSVPVWRLYLTTHVKAMPSSSSALIAWAATLRR